MLFKPQRLWPLLVLALVLQLAAADAFQKLDARQNAAASSVRPDPSSDNSLVNLADNDKTSSSNAPSRTTSVASEKPSGTNDASDSPSSTSPSRSRPNPTSAAATATADPGNPKFLNATIPDGQLPLTPAITPGWGVAGVIMILSGLTYTLVGIKNRWIHTFFSTAYAASLGVAVLIVYVMSVPVSDAAQGGYVAAVVLSGCAVGAASLFFKEMTEGLGCALGGFCFAMWLLCLVPGGLLRAVPSKAIFISAFTLVGFAFYFSRWTRDWALILNIAFAGATITILGFDCFTRAGFKEFWAYIWDVNVNLFPLGADTYPVTKGIRVETAAIIIIFLMGIISQIKLWRILRDKREKRAEERAEDQRNLELEEENVGRLIEEATARDRRRWERVYGQGLSGSGTDSRLSDLGDTGSEKKLRPHAASYELRSSVEAADTAAMSESDLSRNGLNPLVAADETRDGHVTVLVAEDDKPDTPTEFGEEPNEKSRDTVEPHRTSMASKRLSHKNSGSKHLSQTRVVTEAPQIVPLPFCVPHQPESPLEDDRSSIATFAADDNEHASNMHSRRPSLATKLSQGSFSKLELTSQHSGREEPARNSARSLGELVAPKTHKHQEDDGSLAATVDGESVSGDGRRSFLSLDPRKSLDVDAQLSQGQKVDNDTAQESNPLPTKTIPSSETPGDASSRTPVEPGADAAQPRTGVAEDTAALDRTKSTGSHSSTPVSLTRDRLPHSLSRVAMSYRTNEWAKHLGYADAPDVDEPRVAEPARPVKTDKEKSVPVNVAELQKTAEEGAPEPAIIRSDSRASNLSYVPSVSRRTSKRERRSTLNALDGDVPSMGHVATVSSGSNGLKRSSSTHVRRSSAGFKSAGANGPGAVAQAIPEEITDMHLSGNPSFSEIPQSSFIPGVLSHHSPQTLMGQRDAFLRSKSNGNLTGVAQEPTAFNPVSDMASVYGSPMFAADPDNIPLSQRKQIMRQSSLMSLSQQNPSLLRSPASGMESTESLPFNSHQPRRVSTLPTVTMRDAQLANFRQSVQQDLRSGTPVMPASGRETPFSPSSLLANREAEVQRNIEMQRNVLMGQKEAEAQRRESQRRDREFADRAFDERMRTGDLLEAHREAMRKLQSVARDH